MHQLHFLSSALLLSCSFVPVFGKRGSTAGHAVTPTVCNQEPTKVPGLARRSESAHWEHESGVPTPHAGIPYHVVVTSTAPIEPVKPSPSAISPASGFAIRGGPRSQLFKRTGGVTFDNNCQKPLPDGSNKYAGAFEKGRNVLMSDVLIRAWMDVLKLADGVSHVDANSNAYKHYFDTADGAPQHKIWQKMMSLITGPEENFNIHFNCDWTVKECADENKNPVVAFTDATVAKPDLQMKEIHLCKSFWTSAQTRFFLWDALHDVNEPPFRSATTSGWCNTKSTSNFFATMGHTILHELMHLDILGKKAGLEQDPDDKTHGTIDLVSNPNDSKLCQLYGARDWLTYWLKNKDYASPVYNAESHAGAATEAYFMSICKNDELKDIPQ